MSQGKSIKRTLIIGITCILLLTHGAFGYVNYVDLIKIYNREIDSRSRELYTLINANFLTYIEAPIKLLQYTAEEWESSYTLGELQTYLLSIERLYPFFDHIKLINTEGYLVLQAPIDATLSNSSFVYESFFTHQPAVGTIDWSNVYISARTKHPVITASMQFGNYLLVADLDLDKLHKELSKLEEGTVTNITLLDQYGIYVFDKNQSKVEQRMRYPNFDKFAIGDQSVLEENKGTVIISKQLSNEFPGHLILQIDYGNLYHQLQHYKWLLGFKVLMLVLFSGIFIILLMHKVVRELNHLSIMSHELMNGDDSSQNHRFSFSEISRLAEDFKKMRSVIKKRESDAADLNDQLEKLVNIRTESLQLENEMRRKAEEQLLALNADLEKRVEDRTLAVEISNRYLEEVNAQLEEEIQEHTLTLIELRERENELEHALELANQGIDAKKQFVANISHEIRTPMNGIMGMIRLLTESTLDATQIKYVNTIATTSNTLMNILNDVLDYSKIEAGKTVLKNETVEVRNVISEIFNLFTPSAALKRIGYTMEVESNVPQSIIIDETKFKQILSNLLSNAIKFTQEGQVRLSCKTLNNTVGQAFLEIIIADTGIGISQSDQKIIFERFEQGKSTLKNRPNGTGLGLAITKALTEIMSGSIRCQSTPNGGTTFILCLPLIETTANRDEEPSLYLHLGNNGSKSYSNIQVLVAEDDEVSGFIVVSLLEKRGIKVDLVGDGLEAINALKLKSYDLVLLDIKMPVMDGLEAASEIRHLGIKNKYDIEIPLIAMTAFADDDDINNCFKAGCNYHIAKPIDFNRMFTIMDEAIGMH